jgi:hypothetical protein
MKNGLIVDKFGSNQYYLNDLLHREDGPAVILTDGSKYYFINGKYHRDGNLPAIEYPNGTKYYYLNDRPHREDGPAVEYSDGDKEFHLYGKFYLEEDYWEEVKRMKSLNSILLKIKNNYKNLHK